MPGDSKMRGLGAAHLLSQMAYDDTVDSPGGFAQMATLLEFATYAPAVTTLLDLYPVISGRDASGNTTGWGAL